MGTLLWGDIRIPEERRKSTQTQRDHGFKKYLETYLDWILKLDLLNAEEVTVPPSDHQRALSGPQDRVSVDLLRH